MQENFFLTTGALLFIAAGSLELAALESVEERLVDNAAILGVFSLVTGFLFIIDLLTTGKRRKREKFQFLKKSTLSKLTQTDGKNSIFTNSFDDVNGNVQNGHVGDHVGYKIPKNAVKLLPTSPALNEYFVDSERNPNGEYFKPVEYLPEPPAISDLKTHEGRIRSTESFLRSEKGLYPKIRKSLEQDRSNNSYFIPSGYVLVPADHFQSRSPTNDSGIGTSYTPPNYAKVTPSMKVKENKDPANFVMIPVDSNHSRTNQTKKMQSPTTAKSKTRPEAYYLGDRRSTFKSNSSDASDFEDSRADGDQKYELKKNRSQKRHSEYFEIDSNGQKYIVQGDDSSDENKQSWQNDEYSRASSRFSQRSRDHSHKQKGKINEGYAEDKTSFPFYKRKTSFQSSARTPPHEMPKSILRFDGVRSPSKKENGLYFPEDVQYDSLDGQKIAEDLRTLKEITKSDLNLTRNFEQENRIFKERSRQTNENKEKVKRDFKNLIKSETEIKEAEDEKDRRVSEREEQYFGLKDLKQSHREKKFEAVSRSKNFDDSTLGETNRPLKSSQETGKNLNDKYSKQENKAAREDQEFRDLIDERFYFLDEEEKKRKKKTLRQDNEKSVSSELNRMSQAKDHYRLYNSSSGKASEKQRSDSDETTFTPSTDEELRLRVDTPGSASYKSEALVWVENHRENQTEPSTPISPTSPGYVLYTAQNWPESPSPQDRFQFNAKEAQELSIKMPPKPSLLERLKSDFSSFDENTNIHKSRLLDFDDVAGSGKSSVTHQKSLLVRKVDFPKKSIGEFRKPSPVAVGSTSTWKKWLQSKPKLVPTKSAPN